MSILVDWQINHRLTVAPPLATNVSAGDYQGSKSKIQAASLDLTIGEIFVPDTDNEKPGGAYSPLTEYALAEGHTAVIKTKEELHVGDDLAAIAFPPASMSLKGLLMTNPGHIDPGYRGALHLTVINMSKVPFPLKVDDRIVRVLFIGLEEEPRSSYQTRHAGQPQTTPITPELLQRLSVDFVSVEKRAQKIADEAVRKAQIWATAIPVVVAVLTIGGTWLAGSLTNKGDIQKLADRVTVIEAKLSQQALDARLQKLEDAVARIAASAPAR
jgi:dCTP deaminase